MAAAKWVAARKFLVSCPVLLELAEEVLHQVARLVHFPVKRCAGPFDCSWVGSRAFSCCKQRFDHALVGIEGFIRQQGIGLHLRQEPIGSFHVMGLAGSQENRGGLPDASTMAWSLVLNPPLLRPIAWSLPSFLGSGTVLVRTIVLSMMTYSLSASAAGISNTFFHTPLSGAADNRVRRFIGSSKRSGGSRRGTPARYR